MAVGCISKGIFCLFFTAWGGFRQEVKPSTKVHLPFFSHFVEARELYPNWDIAFLEDTQMQHPQLKHLGGLFTDVPAGYHKSMAALDHGLVESFWHRHGKSGGKHKRPDIWHYLDKAGKVQGPFPTETMRDWFEQGFINVRTLACYYGAPPLSPEVASQAGKPNPADSDAPGSSGLNPLRDNIPRNFFRLCREY